MRPMIFACLLIALAVPAHAEPAGPQTVNVDEVWTAVAAPPDARNPGRHSPSGCD